MADDSPNDKPVTPDIQTSETPSVEQETAPTSSGTPGTTGAASPDGAPEQIETQVSTSAPETPSAIQANTADSASADVPAPASTPAAPAPAPASQSSGPAPKQPSMEQVMETDEFAEYMSGAQSLERNGLVTGIVVRLEENGSILVDIGSKSEGIIPRSEIGEEEVEVGASVECLVVRPEDEEGHPILSKRRADFEKTRRDVAAARESGVVLQATVKDAVKGGLIVDLGIDAFVPASHVDQRVRGQLERLVGTILPVKVIETDFRKGRDKVIASHRLAYEEERKSRESEAWDSIEKDKIVEGVVRRITEFGAFVDIGGLDGLLHVREMAWSRVDHPSSVVKKGQKLQVLILDIDEERRRVALGLKQLLPDPWKKAAKNYSVGQVVPIKVLRLAPTVAFVELEPGIEAIIPISELSEDRINKPEDAVSIGQEVEGRIKSIQPNQRRITMSLRAAVAEKERRETRTAVREVNQRAGEDGPLSLGDLFGKELRAVRDRGRNRDRDEARERAEEEADDDDFEEIEAEFDSDVSMEDEVGIEDTSIVDASAQDEVAEEEAPAEGTIAEALKNAGA